MSPLVAVEAAGYRPHLDGLRDGRLLLPRCPSCGEQPWPPTDVCATCGDVPQWTPIADPRGTLFSFTVVRRTTLPAFLERIPYVVGIIQLDAADVRLVGLVLCDDPDRLTIDQPVTPRFATSPDGSPALHWTASDPSPLGDNDV